MYAISPTDKNWFDYLKREQFNSNVNFWTPTPWNIKKLKPKDKLYFMLKSPIRKIGGFGEFVEYNNMTALDAWNHFGYRNGRSSRQEFIDSIQEYIDKNSQKYGGIPIDINNYQIGCIKLDNCEFWDDENFIDITNKQIEFAPQVVTIKYFDQYDIISKTQEENNNFNIVSEPRIGKKATTNIRAGQSEFKAKILRTYNNMCCISGETIPELLEAAHIQEYRNYNSNHVQNGLLLRVDLHRLYDNRLLFIDREYLIHVSSLITSQFYRQYHGQKIRIPNSLSDRPSAEALEIRKDEFRK
jgi:putative restriction endonuclease